MDKKTIFIICCFVLLGITLLIYFLTKKKLCPNNCSNHGKCSNGNCNCDKGYGEIDCSLNLNRNCPNNCSGNGSCNNNTCSCNSGYSGADCGTTIPPSPFPPVNSCPNNCSNNGICGKDGKCSCNIGYYQNDCSVKDLLCYKSSTWLSTAQAKNFTITSSNNCGSIKITGLDNNPTIIARDNKTAELTYHMSLGGNNITLTTTDYTGNFGGDSGAGNIVWMLGDKIYDTWMNVDYSDK
jgi:hypothetical protein